MYFDDLSIDLDSVLESNYIFGFGSLWVIGFGIGSEFRACMPGLTFVDLLRILQISKLYESGLLTITLFDILD